MKQQQSLADAISQGQAAPLFALGQYIEDHIAAQWQTLLETHHAKLLDAYNRAGDMAYGSYCDLLFRPIHKAMKQAGLQASPKFPGDFDSSREWGNQEETDQQRWMWSTIDRIGGGSIGTIVVKIFHDHTRFFIPRQPAIIALTEVGKEAVVDALAQRSDDFKNAREFTVEYAEYLKSQAS